MPAGVLARLATKDPDYRVRLSAIRALPFDAETYSASRKAVFYALSHDRAPVALTAAEWLLAHAKGESGPALAALADGNKQASPRVRAALLQAAVRHASPAARPSLIETIQKRYAAAPTVYEKSFLLQALAEDPASFDLLKAEAFAAGQAPVVAGNALGALLTMRRQADFPVARQADFAAAMRQALASGDVAQLGTAAEALADAKLYPQAQPDDLAALRQAQAKLQLPREIEAWQGLQQALDKLEKAPKPTPTPVATAQQHPIDWAVVQSVPLYQQVRLRTSKGIILLELKPNEAPGAVASFVTLIGQHFYDNLYFHRVVPNFVAQGGDPRGDGNGSAPYNLRSEFGDLRYEEGSVGLASAGKDTESCQFFITHTPTPHLDGRYPIFAQVVGGMDVVHKLDIGDQILGVELVGPGSGSKE
jgi:cyclophilin family peptidyl-prolyl cis-trans isomerase